MPISYANVPYSQLMCHQGAYDLIDHAGRKAIPNWDILEFEKCCLCDHSDVFIKTDSDHDALTSNLSILDKGMPFLEFGEKGQHYAYELFLPFPKTRVKRGDPFFWTFMARQFTFDPLPMSNDRFTSKFRDIIKTLRIPYGGERCAYVPLFDVGGEDGGMVSGQFVKQAHSLLLARLNIARKTAEATRP